MSDSAAKYIGKPGGWKGRNGGMKAPPLYVKNTPCWRDEMNVYEEDAWEFCEVL